MKVFQSLLGVISLFGLSIAALSAQANQLSDIQQKIKQQQNKVAENRQKRNALQNTLKNQEVEMGTVITKLKNTETSLADTRAAIKRTEQEIKRLEQQEKEQKEKLKEQLDSAYRSGINPSTLERLMSESAKNSGRMTAYYEHINQVRIEAIQDLRRTQQELKTRRDELQGQRKGQQTQLDEQKKQENELKKVQSQRESTLRSIDRELEKDESRLDDLKANAEALQQKLANAAKEAVQQEKQEIAKLEEKKNKEENRKATEAEKQQVRAGSGLKGAKYAMPVSGSIVQNFGGSWTGVVIAAPAGTAVKAIAGGRVVISDWLNGYGNMVAVDHGNGDMSIYGYNQNLNVRKGARVSAGQTIATVGNSGGQRRSALYFGITRKGTPVNPLNVVR